VSCCRMTEKIAGRGIVSGFVTYVGAAGNARCGHLNRSRPSLNALHWRDKPGSLRDYRQTRPQIDDNYFSARGCCSCSCGLGVFTRITLLILIRYALML
jgi:hypothetical protein